WARASQLRAGPHRRPKTHHLPLLPAVYKLPAFLSAILDSAAESGYPEVRCQVMQTGQRSTTAMGKPGCTGTLGPERQASPGRYSGDGRRLTAFELRCQKSFTEQRKAAPGQSLAQYNLVSLTTG